jgi:hypothetical protein
VSPGILASEELKRCFDADVVFPDHGILKAKPSAESTTIFAKFCITRGRYDTQKQCLIYGKFYNQCTVNIMQLPKIIGAREQDLCSSTFRNAQVRLSDPLMKCCLEASVIALWHLDFSTGPRNGPL